MRSDLKPNNQEPIENLLPFYAMGTLSDEERERVERYLDENPEARERVGEMTEAVSALAFALEPVTPRGELAESLLSRIRTGADEPRRVSRGLFSGLSRNWASTAVALASLIVAFVSVTWGVAQSAEIVHLEVQLAELEAAITEQNLIISRLASPGVEAFDVLSTEEGSDAGGRLFADPEASSAVLAVQGLDSLPPDQSYQIWLIAGENPVSAGLLPIQDLSTSVHLIETSSSLQFFDAIGISIEPLGGSDLPIGPIVLFAGFDD